MSTKNKKSVAAQALLEMDQITKALKEESKSSLKVMMNEAVKDALRENCNENDDEDDYEVLDNEKDAKDTKKKSSKKSSSDVDEDENPEMEQNPAQGGEQPIQGKAPAMGGQNAPQGEMPEGPAPEGEGEEGWDDFSKYQADDNTYDLTGEKDLGTVAKVYKLLSDEDQVVVKKDGNKVDLKDNGAGTEYIIDLGTDEDEEPEPMNDSEEEAGEEGPLYEMEIAGLPDDKDTFGEDEDNAYDNDVENDYSEDEEDDSDLEDEIEQLQAELDNIKDRLDSDDLDDEPEDIELEESRNFKKTKKPMKESKEVLFEVDLGYTDSYQDKDPIAGLNNNEPSKSGKSWHKGVPTGTEKPWAGDSKSKGNPFKKTQKVSGSVNEEDMMADGEDAPIEETMSVSSQNARKTPHTRAGQVRKPYLPQVTKHLHTNGNYEEVVNENKKLKKQKKELQEAVLAFRDNLKEAYVTNANLGKITKLFLECTTSQAEKVDIVNRFANEAKTVEQSKTLYESIRRELSKTSKNPMGITESSKTANGSKMLNENKVYKSNDVMQTIDLIKRMDNLLK